MTPASRRPATVTAAAIAVGVAGFQTALAAGAPWGAAAWGGAHPGVLPESLRVSSAVSAAAWAAIAVGISTLPPRPRRLLQTGLVPLLGVATVLNVISPSPPERWWALVAASEAALLWVARSEPRQSDSGARA